jgi:hypothetical protein
MLARRQELVMRLGLLAIFGIAAFASANAQPTEEPETPASQEESERPRLGDLDSTVDQLLREESAPTGPAQPQQAATEAAAPDPDTGEDASADEPQADPDSEPSAEEVIEEPPVEGVEPGATPTEDESVEPPAEPDPAPTEGETTEAAPPEPAEPAPPPPPLTREELAELDRTAERGRRLIAIARAGIIATQDMLSRVSDPEGAGIAGWIAEPAGNGMSVTFYADGEDGPTAVYRTNLLGGRVSSREVFLSGDRPALNPLQARMAAARAAAMAIDERRPCGADQFNYLILPPAGVDAPVTVYQISPQTERGRFPLGGHYRTIVAEDGSVTETRGFTNACLDVDVPAAVEGQPPRPIAVTHLLDPMPAEIHVLAAALVGRPLVVVAGEPQRLFGVTAEAIGELRPSATSVSQ